ncbi:MAG: hypothetical protein M3R31_01455 [Pseudomonadota bacterium]|nr:hypothetical protein [Pseudomonadota bacterium]
MTASKHTTIVRHGARPAHLAGIAAGGDARIAPNLEPDKPPTDVKAIA